MSPNPQSTESNHSEEEISVTVKPETAEQFEQNAHFDERREDLRREVLARRAGMPKPYRAHKSSAICDELEGSLALTCAMLDLEPANCTVAVYSAFEEEVQLDQFIRALYEKGVSVAFPCMVKDAWGMEEAKEPDGTVIQQTMEMRLVSRDAYENNSAPFLAHPLRSFHHDSTELADYPYVPAIDLNMIVIPLVAFDVNKNRLGYGGGNYDRYLPQVSDECRIIGVAFSEQEVAFIPAEEHDIPINVLAL